MQQGEMETNSSKLLNLYFDVVVAAADVTNAAAVVD